MSIEKSLQPYLPVTLPKHGHELLKVLSDIFAIRYLYVQFVAVRNSNRIEDVDTICNQLKLQCTMYVTPYFDILFVTE